MKAQPLASTEMMYLYTTGAYLTKYFLPRRESTMQLILKMLLYRFVKTYCIYSLSFVIMTT